MITALLVAVVLAALVLTRMHFMVVRNVDLVVPVVALDVDRDAHRAAVARAKK
jgi:hypothetical protein